MIRRAALTLLLALPAAAEPRVAVAVSAPLPPYDRAMAAFSAALGEPVAVLRPVDGKFPPPPPGTRLVAAFGGRAAMAPWPAEVGLVHCLTLGLRLKRASATVAVGLLPGAAKVVRLLRERPERLDSLAVLWADRGHDRYVRRLAEEGRGSGLRVLSLRLSSREELPAVLRELPGRAQAVLLMPDPDLISATTVDMLAAFAKAHRIVFAAATEDLISRGATLSVGASYEEVGRAAAEEAAALLRGESRPGLRDPGGPFQ